MVSPLLPENLAIRRALKGFADEVFGGNIDGMSQEEVRGISVVFLMGFRYAQEIHQPRVESVKDNTCLDI